MAASGEVGPVGPGPQVPTGLRRRSRLLLSIRVLFGVLTIGALVSGFLGIREFMNGLTPAELAVLGTSFRDIAYYDLQLFVLSSQPLTLRGEYPLLLDIARFAAPAATALALAEAAHAIFASQYHAWRERHRRGHGIVTGDTAIARAIVAELRKGRSHVSWITDGSAESLVRAGVRGASVVFACADDTAGDSTLNVVTAQTASTTKRWRRHPGALRIYAQVTDPLLALSLRARWLGQPGMDRPDVDFFTVDVLAARACLRPGDFPTVGQGPPAITIAGWGTFGRALLVEYAQLWQVQSEGPTDRIKVTVVGATQAEIDDVASRWDVIGEVCDIIPVRPDDAPWLCDGPLPYRTFVCYEDENLALTTALTASRLWAGGPDSVVVRLNKLALPADPKEPSTLTLIDDVGGCLRVVSVTALACKPSVIMGEDIVERLAQSIHRRYLLARRADHTPMYSTPAMVWWKDATRDIRDANRHPARHIGAKVTMVAATVAPRTGPPIPFDFTPDEIELLARAEHERWFKERTSAGWRFGPRDDATKRHPSLVDWPALPVGEQEKDRDAVRDLEHVLADVGLQMVRLTPRPTPVELPVQATVSS